MTRKTKGGHGGTAPTYAECVARGTARPVSLSLRPDDLVQLDALGVRLGGVSRSEVLRRGLAALRRELVAERDGAEE